jgi:diguanylate cyclase (GGDEF)-like protein
MENQEYPALNHIKKLLQDRKIPPLEGELAEIPLLQDIHQDLKAIRETLSSVAGGDLSVDIGVRGIIPGCIKTLQARLRHLIWQIQMVAQGDFTQEAQFMGEFSEAFNRMVCQMDATLKSLREKEAALTALTKSLRTEVDLRAAAAEALQESESRFKYLASHDPLTGTMNRRAFMERAAEELKTAEKLNRPCGIVMMDIDRFKDFNDTWGHQAGDEALRHIVQVIGRLLRKNDFLGRYGGEEFVFLIEGSGRGVVTAIAERVRQAVARRPVKLETGPVTITASFGVALSGLRKGSKESIEALIRDADVALYRAKAAGRNRVVCFNPEDAEGKAAHTETAGLDDGAGPASPAGSSPRIPD